MAKSRRLEIALEQIKNIQRLEALAESDIETLQKIILSKQPMAIAPAAQLICQHNLVQLIPDMVTAFHRMLKNGEKTDPSCKAKWAIANTLYKLERPDVDLFLAGIRHVQNEPVWRGAEDTASSLRSLCALGLVQANYGDVFNELVDLLVDEDPIARAGAARAIGYSRNPAGVPVLRLKVHLGDTEPMVLSECFIALLQLSGEQAPMVIKALTSDHEAVQELAAIALGEARVPEAFEAIKRQLKRTRSTELRQSFLLAIATLRTDESLAYLLNLIERGSLQEAEDALISMDIYRHTTEIWQRVLKVAQLRADIDLEMMPNS